MAKLVAVGPDANQRLECDITDGVTLRMGRKPLEGVAISWDRMISREHADIVWKNGQLHVTCHSSARNPLIHEGKSHHNLVLKPNDSFRIGDTVFTIHIDEDQPDLKDDGDSQNSLTEQHSYNSQEINKFEFRDTKLQMQLLEKVPDILESAETDTEMAARMAELLLECDS